VIALEPLRDEDSDTLFAWINDRELVEQSATFRPVSRAEHDAWFRAVRDPGRDDLVIYAIREDGRLVGTCQLLIDGAEAELRIRIGVADARGRGLGTEAVRELVRIAFADRGVQRVWLQVFAHNTRAIRTYEKAGFVRCGEAAGGATLLMERVSG